MAYNPNLYMPNYGYGYQQPNYPLNSLLQYQNAQPLNGLVYVTGIDGARAYQMPPSSKMPLFDEHDDVLYLKTTDAAGYPTIKTFRFEPFEQEAAGYKADAITRDEWEDLCQRVTALEGQPARARSTRKAASDE